MDDRRLEIFLATIKTGSLSKAAQITNCSQSAVTQIMNNLETELNCKLLERNHSGVKLTDDGEILLPFILDANSSITRLLNQAKIISEGQITPIRIGAFSSIAKSYLPSIIKAYQTVNPSTIFDIKIGTDILPKWLLNNEIDIALGDETRLNGFPFHPLVEDPYFAVMPKEFIKIKTEFISQEEFVKFPFIMAPMNALKNHLTVLPEKSINVTCDDDSTLLSMVSKGLGVTIMPELSLNQLSDNIYVMELTPSTKRIIGFSTSISPDKKIQAFSEYLTSNHEIFSNKKTL